MVFISAGMGGGTGTGAAPVIAQALRDAKILTVGVVTKPYNYEGIKRAKTAEVGLEELSKYLDTLIVISNQNLFKVASEETTYDEAFRMADDVLYHGISSITDLITRPGLINMDFADVRTVMQGMGRAMIGCGECEGENRAIRAAEMALENPLLDNDSMIGARGVLVNITGGKDMKLNEVDAAANRIRAEVDDNVNIRFGSCLDEALAGKMRISIVAAGMSEEVSSRDVLGHYDEKFKKQVKENVSPSVVNVQPASKFATEAIKETVPPQEEKVRSVHVAEEKSNPEEEKNAFSWNSFFTKAKEMKREETAEPLTRPASSFRFLGDNNAPVTEENEPEFVVNEVRASQVTSREEVKVAPSIPPRPEISKPETQKPFIQDMFATVRSKIDEDKKSEQTDLEDILEIPTFLRKK
jgi:cell division protein FtsZ